MSNVDNAVIGEMPGFEEVLNKTTGRNRKMHIGPEKSEYQDERKDRFIEYDFLKSP